jgi:hypothetical protein
MPAPIKTSEEDRKAMAVILAAALFVFDRGQHSAVMETYFDQAESFIDTAIARYGKLPFP